MSSSGCLIGVAMPRCGGVERRRGARARSIEISRLEGPVEQERRRHIRPEQAFWPRTAAAADGRSTRRSSRRASPIRPRAGRATIRWPGACRRHAADDDRLRAGMEIVITPDTTYMLFGEPMNQLRRIYHRRPRMAGDDRADDLRLFDRAMGGYRRRRPLRHAGGRDPRHQGAAQLRFKRHAVPQGRQDRRPGAVLSRQGQSRHLMQRDHGRGQRADASLDGHAALPPHARAGVAGDHLRRGRAPAQHRQRGLLRQRRWFSDADPQGPAAAGLAAFRSIKKVERCEAEGGGRCIGFRSLGLIGTFW